MLAEWLPPSGLVLEIASGTGEHVVHFAERFPALEWQPSDIHKDALASIEAWRASSKPGQHPRTGGSGCSIGKVASRPRTTRCSVSKWQSDSCVSSKAPENSGFDAVLNLNMVHISPWTAALGLLNGASRVLKRGGALILYGPWLKGEITTASSNLEFDRQLRERDPEWGLRHVEDFEAEAVKRNFALEQVCQMPANNLMLFFRLRR